MELPRVCNSKPYLQYTCRLVCDVVNFICDLKLFKAVNRNYFYVAESLTTITLSINYGKYRSEYYKFRITFLIIKHNRFKAAMVQWAFFFQAGHSGIDNWKIGFTDQVEGNL